MERLIDSRGTDANFETHWYQMLEKYEKWGYAQEDKAFIDAILEGKEPPVTALDGYKSVELVESVYEAIRTGEKLKFD
jgi:myo-inositol 2-dehydrogenase / D-chiro-inositol 1-dehydrogenase